MPVREPSPPERNGAITEVVESGIDPLMEAEALRVALTDAATRIGRIIAWLKQSRKERRALASAFSSLRQLNLSP